MVSATFRMGLATPVIQLRKSLTDVSTAQPITLDSSSLILPSSGSVPCQLYIRTIVKLTIILVNFRLVVNPELEGFLRLVLTYRHPKRSLTLVVKVDASGVQVRV